jgi:hypothetical protein
MKRLVSVLKQLDDSVMKYVRHVILVTPAIGSNTLVFSYLKQAGYAAEVISLSTYYAATKGYESSVNVLTKGVKKKIYIGSVWENSELCRKISSLLQQLGIEVELVKNPYEAESRNISIYVHPPIFMNEYALDIIFRGNNSIKYAYKFYPEGPLTQYVIHDIVEQWKEISFLLTYCKVERFNLLMFLNDDNYPVRLQSLSRDDIENFLFFDAIKQEYLIYIRYTALLIDPFSEPDEKGRYFDFSAVPIQKIYQDQEGYWHVPRIPKEEYYRLKLLQGIARWASVRTHTIDKFIKNYEQKLHWFKQVHKELMISHDFIPQDFGDDLRVICNALKIKGSLEHHE